MRFQYIHKPCFYSVLFGIMVLAPSGCSLPGDSLINVKGKVSYGNEPLRSTGLDTAVVQFRKISETGGSELNSYQGDLDAEGNYSLKAPPGKYRALVIASKMPKGKDTTDPKYMYASPESVIPKVYSDPNLSDRFVEVRADAAPETYHIKLAK